MAKTFGGKIEFCQECKGKIQSKQKTYRVGFGRYKKRVCEKCFDIIYNH